MLRRGIDTLQIALAGMGLASVPVVESWYLNERHFGALQGMGHVEAVWRFGPRRVLACQRRYATPPPPLAAADPRHPARDARYADVDGRELPATESLRDTVERMRPFWRTTLEPELRRGRNLLVVAHKNSLRAIMRLLEVVGDDEVPRLSIRTGRPLQFALDDRLSVVGRRYLDEPARRPSLGLAVEPTASARDA